LVVTTLLQISGGFRDRAGRDTLPAVGRDSAAGVSARLRWIAVAGCALGLSGVLGCSGQIEGPGTGPDGLPGSGADGMGGLPGAVPGGPGAGAAGAGAADPNMPGVDPMLGADPFEPPPAALRRLTIQQYVNSVQELLGDVELSVELEADTAISGFVAIGAARTTISPTAMEKYEEAAYELAAQALTPERREDFVGCTPDAVIDSTCTRDFVTRFGRKAFRRPLTAEEVDRYVGVAEEAAEALDDFHQGLEFAVAGLLLSPNFLFRVELGAQDPVNQALVRYDGFELASRMSYLLVNSTPGDALLDAAEGGELDTPAGIAAQLETLLADPRVRDALRSFHAERLGLESFALDKDEDLFPEADDALADAMRQDVLRTLDDLVFEEDGDFRTAFSTRVSYVDAALAELYGVDGPDSGFARVELPADGLRVGLLGKAALLARGAHVQETSPTLRGKLVRERVLCQSIPAPPNNVLTVLPEPDPNAPTMRDRLQQHRTDPACSSCHSLTDPIGLAFENFDALGRYRDDDDGHVLDVAGDVDGVAFDGPAQLAMLLAQNDKVTECVVRQLYRYAVAHIETTGEKPVIAALSQSFATEQYRLQALLRAVVLSDGFRYAGRVEE
jgi:hypothetical protein